MLKLKNDSTQSEYYLMIEQKIAEFLHCHSISYEDRLFWLSMCEQPFQKNGFSEDQSCFSLFVFSPK